MSNEILRKKLNEYLYCHGIMQKHVCEICGISPTTINQFIKGKRDISYKKLMLIHQYLTNENNLEVIN